MGERRSRVDEDGVLVDHIALLNTPKWLEIVCGGSPVYITDLSGS
jgi:hypothetical protein